MSAASNKSTQSRQQRRAEQAAALEAQKRKQRLMLVGGALAGLVALLAILLVAGVFKKDNGAVTKVDGVEIAGVDETNKLLDGIPQNGLLLGKKNAKVTIHEFADLKCHACKEFAESTLPDVVNKLIKTGKANLRMHFVATASGNSADGMRIHTAVNNMSKSSKRLFNFVDVAYKNQGLGNQEWATEETIKAFAKAAGVKDADVSMTSGPLARKLWKESADMAAQFQGLGTFSGTPSIYVQPRGLTKVFKNVDSGEQLPTFSAISNAVRTAADRAK